MKNYFQFTQGRIIQGRKGMTLMEIMIVLVIVGSLMAILAPNVMRQLRSGNVRQARIQIQTLKNHLGMFYAACGFFPDSGEGLQALVEAPSNCPEWGPEPYIDKVPRDPWNNEFVYERDGSSYIVSSLGADGREGGTGSDKDISSDDE